MQPQETELSPKELLEQWKAKQQEAEEGETAEEVNLEDHFQPPQSPPENSPKTASSHPTHTAPKTASFHPTHTVNFDANRPVDSLPLNSRLFIGNLATEKTNREEIASIFVKYGNILEISLKGSYGFVQFDNHVSCENAINSENRRLVGDLKLDLKTAKDKNQKREEKRQQQQRDQQRRSDRRDYSPQRGPRNDRYERDHIYDDHASRRYRNVPECQVIVYGDEVDKGFIGHLEAHIRKVGIQYDVEYLSLRDNLQFAADQFRQEGVAGIIFAERQRQRVGQVAAQIYSISGLKEFDNLSFYQATNLFMQERDQRAQMQAPNPQMMQMLGGFAGNQMMPPVNFQQNPQMMGSANMPPPNMNPPQMMNPPPNMNPPQMLNPMMSPNIAEMLNQLNQSSKILSTIDRK